MAEGPIPSPSTDYVSYSGTEENVNGVFVASPRAHSVQTRIEKSREEGPEGVEPSGALLNGALGACSHGRRLGSSSNNNNDDDDDDNNNNNNKSNDHPDNNNNLSVPTTFSHPFSLSLSAPSPTSPPLTPPPAILLEPLTYAQVDAASLDCLSHCWLANFSVTAFGLSLATLSVTELCGQLSTLSWALSGFFGVLASVFWAVSCALFLATSLVYLCKCRFLRAVVRQEWLDPQRRHMMATPLVALQMLWQSSPPAWALQPRLRAALWPLAAAQAGMDLLVCGWWLRGAAPFALRDARPSFLVPTVGWLLLANGAAETQQPLEVVQLMLAVGVLLSGAVQVAILLNSGRRDLWGDPSGFLLVAPLAQAALGFFRLQMIHAQLLWEDTSGSSGFTGESQRRRRLRAPDSNHREDFELAELELQVLRDSQSHGQTRKRRGSHTQMSAFARDRASTWWEDRRVEKWNYGNDDLGSDGATDGVLTYTEADADQQWVPALQKHSSDTVANDLAASFINSVHFSSLNITVQAMLAGLSSLYTTSAAGFLGDSELLFPSSSPRLAAFTESFFGSTRPRPTSSSLVSSSTASSFRHPSGPTAIPVSFYRSHLPAPPFERSLAAANAVSFSPSDLPAPPFSGVLFLMASLTFAVLFITHHRFQVRFPPRPIGKYTSFVFPAASLAAATLLYAQIVEHTVAYAFAGVLIFAAMAVLGFLLVKNVVLVLRLVRNKVSLKDPLISPLDD